MNSRERERERARVQEGDRDPVDAVRTSKLQTAPFASTSRRSRSEIANSPSRRSRSTRCFTRLQSTLREFAPSITISPSRLSRSTLREITPSIAISPSRRSRSTLRKIAPSIAISQSGAVLREIAINGAVVRSELAKHRIVEPSRASSVNLGAVFVFLVLSFSL